MSVNGQQEDPLVPGRLRLHLATSQPPLSGEQPSARRPFVLRGCQQVTPMEARHRTPSHQTHHPQKTHQDNIVDDDSYFTPDD